MVTIKKIAELSGVSRGTVDRVLNNRPGVKSETEQKIRKIAKELGYHPNMAGQLLASRKKKYHLLFIIYASPLGVFFENIFHAAQQKAKELHALGIAVEFVHIQKFDTEYLEKQFNQIKLEEFDGIAIAPLAFQPIQRFIDRIEEKGIPLVFFNSEDQSKNRLCYVGSDYYQAGKVAAGLTALSIAGKGIVGIITLGTADMQSVAERLRGFEDEISTNYNTIDILKSKKFEIASQGDYLRVSEEVKKHPEINAFYVVNAGDCSICKEIQKTAGDRRVVIITNSLMPAQVELLHKNIISATIDQQPEVQGSLPLQILYEYLVFGRKPVKDKYYTELNIYISQNV